MKTVKFIILTLIITLGSLTSAVKAESLIESAADTTVTLNDEQIAQNERIEKSLVYGLTSDVPGVMESVLFNSVHYKLIYPEFASEKVEQMIKQIALEGPNQTLRYKAYLTLVFHKNRDQFGKSEDLMVKIDHRNQNQIFFYLTQQVQEGLATTYN